MSNYVINADPGKFDITGISFITYGSRYRDAYNLYLSKMKTMPSFDPLPYYLLCHSLELYLKSFIWLKDRIGIHKIKNKYSHDIIKLWRHAKLRRIHPYARPTILRDQIIEHVGPYYKNRQFSYLDVGLVFEGYRNIKSEPRILPTLHRLTIQLDKSLRPKIKEAS
jgi:hypothetical protein